MQYSDIDISSKAYLQLLNEAKQRITSTRISLARIAAQEQFSLYWWLGQMIVEAQEKHGWGKSIVQQLSADLRQLFPSTTHGFSSRNLWDMRRFYMEYKDHSNLRQLVAEIPWGQNLVILNKIKDLKTREYYIRSVREQGWTRNILVMQINSNAHERHMLSHKQVTTPYNSPSQN